MEGRSKRSADAGGLVQVFHAEWQSVQWAEPFAFGERFVRGQGLGHQLIFRDHGDHGVDFGIHAVDLLEVGLHHFTRRKLLGAEACRMSTARMKQISSVGAAKAGAGSNGAVAAAMAALAPSFRASRRVIWDMNSLRGVAGTIVPKCKADTVQAIEEDFATIGAPGGIASASLENGFIDENAILAGCEAGHEGGIISFSEPAQFGYRMLLAKNAMAPGNSLGDTTENFVEHGIGKGSMLAGIDA